VDQGRNWSCSWVGAPRNTPAEIIDGLNKEINAGLADPRIKGLIASWGSQAFVSSPEEFGKFIVEETEKWGKVVTFSGTRVYWSNGRCSIVDVEVPSFWRCGKCGGRGNKIDVRPNRKEQPSMPTKLDYKSDSSRSRRHFPKVERVLTYPRFIERDECDGASLSLGWAV
jgi:hypothetical protein